MHCWDLQNSWYIYLSQAKKCGEPVLMAWRFGGFFQRQRGKQICRDSSDPFWGDQRIQMDGNFV